MSQAQEISSSSSGKKKTKFVNLYAQEGQDKLAVLLPGRHSCECLAQKHKLINNCVSCGRIVCEQEGSGPCLFCGNLVSFTSYPSFVSHFLFFFFCSSFHFWWRFAQERSRRFCNETPTKARSSEKSWWEVRVWTERIIKFWMCFLGNKLVFSLMADCGERELLPHQEAKIKAGLDKAIQHKEKLLEFDRNRYKMHNFSGANRFVLFSPHFTSCRWHLTTW